MKSNTEQAVTFTDPQLDAVEVAVQSVMLERFHDAAVDGIALSELEARFLAVQVSRLLGELGSQMQSKTDGMHGINNLLPESIR